MKKRYIEPTSRLVRVAGNELLLNNSLLNDVRDHRQDLDGMKEGANVDQEIDIEVGGWQKPGDGFEYAKPETWFEEY